MEYDVYADIMFLTNLTVDFFIISISRLILKHHTSFLKMLLAAIFGAVYATVTYFLDFIPFALKVLIDIISLAVITIITYGFGNYKRTLLRISLVFLLSLLFGGVVFAFYFFTPLGAVFYLFDGSYYFDISFITVFFLAAASASVCFAVSKIKTPVSALPSVMEATVTVFGKDLHAKAFLDTGNSLTESIYGLPVLVCDYSFIEPILPVELKGREKFSDISVISSLPYELSKRIKTVFARSLGGESLMLAFPVDLLEIKDYGFIAKEAVIAVSPNTTGKFPLIISPAIF